MEYSIQALSRLSGVTTRTLRWYDEIGLLKPSRVAESGYRYYGPAEVDRLQDILYYRALGVELARIKRCLDDPSFDRLAALRSHLTALEAERARLEGLIRSVRQTIGAEERKEIMDDKQKFEAFKQRVVDWHQETYGAEARGRYGDAEVDEADETGDLSEVARSPRWGLVMEWRGMRAPMALPADGLSIGRASDNDVVLKDAAVSRRHVVVEPDDGVVLVHDAGATHPATLDGEEVVDCVPWLPGSVLEICGARFSLELLDLRR